MKAKIKKHVLVRGKIHSIEFGLAHSGTNTRVSHPGENLNASACHISGIVSLNTVFNEPHISIKPHVIAPREWDNRNFNHFRPINIAAESGSAPKNHRDQPQITSGRQLHQTPNKSRICICITTHNKALNFNPS